MWYQKIERLLARSKILVKVSKGGKMVPLMFSADNAIYKLFINESEENQGFPGSDMDYFGSEDEPGGHSNGGTSGR